MNPEFIKIINKDGDCMAIRAKNIVTIKTADSFNQNGYSTVINVEVGDTVQVHTAKETLADIEAQMYPLIYVGGGKFAR